MLGAICRKEGGSFCYMENHATPDDIRATIIKFGKQQGLKWATMHLDLIETVPGCKKRDRLIPIWKNLIAEIESL